MQPLILSGGPAVGKTTCGRRLALERDRAAYVDADDIRQLIVAGDAPLWSGPEGEAQHLLATHNVSALGRNLLGAGFDVTIADIATTATLPVYRAELPGCFVVHLKITLEAAHERAATRKVWLTNDEFELLHRVTASPPDVDVVIDVTELSIDEQVARLRDAWEHASAGIR